MASLKKFERCHESHHLTLQQWGLLSVCLKLTSGGKNKLFFDGRKMAARFSGMSKSTIYRIVAKLEEGGWLVPQNATSGKTRKTQARKPDGSYVPTEYTVLTHEAWAENNGTQQCLKSEGTVPTDENGAVPTDENGPFPKQALAVPKTDISRSQNSASPFPPVGHSFIKDSSIKENSVEDSSVGSALGSAGLSSPNFKIDGDAEKVLRHPIDDPFPSTGTDSAMPESECSEKTPRPEVNTVQPLSELSGPEMLNQLPTDRQWALYRRHNGNYGRAEIKVEFEAWRAEQKQTAQQF